MLDVLEQLARMAALQATAVLDRQSFGAVEEVRFESGRSQQDEEGGHFRLRWSTYSMGLPGFEINMVVLPEFLSGNIEDLEYFQEQLTAYIVEQVLAKQGQEAE